MLRIQWLSGISGIAAFSLSPARSVSVGNTLSNTPGRGRPVRRRRPFRRALAGDRFPQPVRAFAAQRFSQRCYPKRCSRPPEGQTDVTLAIEGMTCGNCCMKVETAVNELEGVVAAKADYKAGRATITYVEGEVTGLLPGDGAGIRTVPAWLPVRSCPLKCPKLPTPVRLHPKAQSTGRCRENSNLPRTGGTGP